MATYIVLLGPPGAGKGTQAQRISSELALQHISSGDLFRENLKAQTELGKLAQSYMNKGELVPDDITIAMVRDRLLREDCQNGALLDGFPRTPTQAESLDRILDDMGERIICAPFISVPAEVLIERLSGRWVCKTCGYVYHEKYNPPEVPGICDKDGGEIYQRDDDKPETVKNRINVYFEQTAPLIEYYKEHGLLIEVDGTLEISEVTDGLLKQIKERL